MQKCWCLMAVFKLLMVRLFIKDATNEAQILQGLTCKVSFVLVPIQSVPKSFPLSNANNARNIQFRYF